MEFQGNATGKRGFRERDAEQNRTDYNRDAYYTLRIGPMDFYNQSTTLTTSGGVPLINFAGSSDQIARISQVKPALWRNGILRVCLWWNTDGTSTDDVDLGVIIAAHEPDKLVSASSTTLYDATPTLIPSGTANYILYSEFETDTNGITNDHKWIRGVFTRSGSTDTNTDDFQILAMKLVFLPEVRQ